MSSPWQGRRVLITGATGLVGSWVSASLVEQGAEVVAFVRDLDPASQLVRSGTWDRLAGASWGKVEDLDDVRRAVLDHRPDTIFHLAAQTQVRTAYRDPFATFQSNAMGTAALLEACRRHPEGIERICVASSDKAYGDTGQGPAGEERLLAGHYPYDASKVATELITRSFVATYGLPVAIARCGNIFGGGDLNFDRLVPGVIRWLLAGERPIIRSDGTFVRDYIYVRDVVTAYLTLADQAGRPGVRGEAFNFSNDQPRDVLTLVAELQDVMGTALELDVRGESPAEIHTQILSPSRARDELGWEANWGLRAGLEETAAWYREFLAARKGARS